MATSEMLRKKVLKELIREGTDVFPQIVGQEKTKKQVLSSLISGRNVLIVGFPGVGKTTLAKAVSDLLPSIQAIEGCPFHCDPGNPVCPSCIGEKKSGKKLKSVTASGASRFVRVQGSPDLCVEDLLGDIDPVKALEFGPTDPRSFTPGKLLKANRGVLFFDEINRCPERLQNALLQVVEEGKATIANYELDYPSDFVMIATMNPAEYVGVERMSDVLMDRFDVVRMGYPESPELEERIVRLKGKNLKVNVPDDVVSAIVKLVRLTRTDERISRPAGVRASIGLFERAQSNALLDGRFQAGMDDVIDAALSVLSYKIKLSPKYKHTTSPEEVVNDLLDKVRNELLKKPPDPSGKKQPQQSSEPTSQKPPSTSPSSSTKSKKIPDDAKAARDARLLRSMLNRGITGIDSKFMARNMIIDLKSALGTYGSNVIEGLTGRTIVALKKLEGRSEQITSMTEIIDEKLEALKDEGLLDDDGVSDDGLELAGLDILSDELKELKEQSGAGEHESQVREGPKGPNVVDVAPFRRGAHAYSSLALRKTLRTALMRGHTKAIRKEDLRVFERSRRAGVDFVYALDVSGSMRGDKIDSAKRAAIGLAYTSMQEKDRVAVVSFSREARRIVGLGEVSDIMDFAKKIAGLFPSQTTNLAEGISRSLDVLREEGASGMNRHIILISDAMPTVGGSPVEAALEQANRAKAMNATLSVVGITLTPEGESIARRIAGLGGGEFYHVSRPQEIRDAVLVDAERMREKAEDANKEKT